MPRRLSLELLLTVCVATFAWFAEGAEPATATPLVLDVAKLKTVANRFQGRPGVVLHIGDSMTYANPYGQWPRSGAGQTAEQKALLSWMHTGANDDTDGFWLCRVDHADGGRSETASSGLRADELLAGGKNGLPKLRDLLSRFRPQMAVVMIGTNDASARRPADDYIADLRRIVAEVTAQGCLCVVTTIPPHFSQTQLAASFNIGLRDMAKELGLPLIDLEAAILERRPEDWNGTLLNKDDVHLSANFGSTTPASEPTTRNLKNSGYLLRSWLTIEALRQIKVSVLDQLPAAAIATEAGVSPVADITPAVRPAPRGRSLKLPVTRDTWFCNVGEQANGNLGGATKLKLKSHQEMSLVDFDAAPLRGKTVLAATLHVQKSGTERLGRVTVSGFSSDWTEGTATNYGIQNGSSTFRARSHPGVAWAGPGSDLTSVTLGNGFTFWSSADAFPPDEQGWQSIAIEPRVIKSRVAGLSFGCLVYDDTGTEWTRDGEKVTIRAMPNRYVASRESGDESAPYFTFVLGDDDTTPPAAVTGLQTESATSTLPGGSVLVSWLTPADKGTGTLGFQVKANGQLVPAWMVPTAGLPGDRVVLHLHDIDLGPGPTVTIAVRPVDGAGNMGEEATFRAVLSTMTVEPLPGVEPRVLFGGGPLPKLAGVEIAILDPLDKINPVSGAGIPAQPVGYVMQNHLWNARNRRIHLHAARNETVGFQIQVRDPIASLEPSLEFATGSADPAFFVLRHVGGLAGPLPDPVVPLSGVFSVPYAPDGIKQQRFGSLLCEFTIPSVMPAGDHRGVLELKSGEEVLKLDVVLTVWDFALPESLSFLPEMNTYGLPENERDYYRLAHRHRTVLNRVPYSQRGDVDDGCAPVWRGKTLDWSAWDKRFGQYFDGTAFADLPRHGVPLECFYLPLHENWPTPVEGNYSGDYWAERSFPEEYWIDFAEVTRQFARHFDEKGWSKTLFQAYLNNKFDFKAKGWSRTSAPWILDEPANFKDFWALRYYGSAFRAGLGRDKPLAKLVFRADISRPQWQRDVLDPVLDYNVVSGGAFRQYNDLVLKRKQRLGQIVVDYGTANPVTESNVQPAGWCLDSWSLGSDGVVPWQTMGTAGSWKQADQLALFYPGAPAGLAEPVPSLRLKSFQRGQQDVEYLTLLTQISKRPRWAIEQRVRALLQLQTRINSTGAAGEDAGSLDVGHLLPQDLWALRVRIGEYLTSRNPPDAKVLVEWSVPAERDIEARGGYVTVGAVPTPEQLAAAPVASAGSPVVMVTRTIQGRPAVRDAIIDIKSEAPLGAEPKDNRLLGRRVPSVLLLRFDTGTIKPPTGLNLQRARVSIQVWDPSSSSRTKVGVFPMLAAWEEETVTWRRAVGNRKWKGEDGFSLAADAGSLLGSTIIEPDAGGDTAEPPIAYEWDVTDQVRKWLSGEAPNHGLALSPIADAEIDMGHDTRIQVYASEYRTAEYGPKLTLEFGK